jgi:TM2 domain-containing membrane protein YozV
LGILLFSLDEYDYYDKDYTEYYDYNGDGYTDKIEVEEWVSEEKWGGGPAGFTVLINSFSLFINDIIDSAATTHTDNFYRLPKELKTWYNAPRKSHFAAGFLSFISPGGGHYYNGKPIKGFLYNALTTACFAISGYCFGGESYYVHRDKTIYVWDEDRGYYRWYKYICEGSQSTYEQNNPTLGWVLFFGGCALRIVDIIHAVIDAGKYNERLMQGLLPERRGELPMTLTMQYRPREKDLLLGLGIRF